MPESGVQVTFSPSAAGALKQALLRTQRRDEVLYPSDDFSFGPIAPDSAEVRVRWVDKELGFKGWADAADRSAAFLAAFEPPPASVTAWFSRREALSYTGFLWWLSHLGDIPISILEVAELSIMNAESVAELLDRAVALSTEKRALYQARWEQLKIENAPLRVLNGEGLVSADIEYFDGNLLCPITPEWQRMARVIGNTFAEFAEADVHQTGDLVLRARLAHLAEAGRLEWRGDLTNMQRCELRLPNP